VGQNHTCGLNSSGQAYCWGQGTGGELGDNTLVSKRTPVAVCGGYNFCNIQAGASWTTAVTNTGQIYSWGVNATDTNQYNFGNVINITTPNLVTYI
jgi:alpha-tubulin suppressor-like RCC1 family protein